MTRNKIEARDRRASAVHDAGHLVIARHFAIVRFNDTSVLFPHARIWRNVSADLLYGRTWTGQCRGINASALGPVQRRMFGVAGYVAEAAWRDNDESFLDFDYDTLSPTDKLMCGPYDHHLERAANHVARLFERNKGKLWRELVSVSRRLIVEARF